MFSSTGTKINNDNPAKINDLGDALTTSDYVDTVLGIISVFANRFISEHGGRRATQWIHC